jgi:hypothetical protein
VVEVSRAARQAAQTACWRARTSWLGARTDVVGARWSRSLKSLDEYTEL